MDPLLLVTPINTQIASERLQIGWSCTSGNYHQGAGPDLKTRPKKLTGGRDLWELLQS